MINFQALFSQLYQQFSQTLSPEVLNVVITVSPIVLVFILAEIFFPLWVDYVRSMQFLGLKYTTLEIKLPKETLKSPAAMELFFHGIHNTSDGNKFKQYWNGETRPWYSLEIISIEGKVKFMAWLEDRRKNGFMTALYAQFPGIEVHEVPDYAKSVHFDEKTMKMWCCEMEFTNKNPAYPIKTYVDYGLDKDPDEELKVDPLVPVLEYLGSVGPNQQVWIQIVIRAHLAQQSKPGFWFAKHDEWTEAGKKEVDKILMRDSKTKVSGVEDEETGLSKKPTISAGEQDVAEAIERSISKLPFDVGIRCMYLSKKDIFDTQFGIGGIIGSFKHFSSQHLNGFKPAKKWVAKIDSPWQDYRGIRRTNQSKAFLMAYKLRSHFYTPFEGKSLVLNTEELATIYHFPGSTAAVPSMQRVPSKKSDAPSNLPI